MGKWAVLLISAVAYLLLLQNPGLLIDTGTVAMGGTAQIFVPTVGALFWKRSNAKAAALGISVGVFILLALALAVQINASYCALIALGFNTLIFVFGSAFLTESKETQERIMEYKNEFDLAQE